MSNFYLLNSPVITDFGEFSFTGPLSIQAARDWIAAAHGFVSAIGHPGAAQFLEQLLEVHVPVNRISITMAPGDEALVLRLKERLPEGAILTAAQTANFPHDLGILRRIK